MNAISFVWGWVGGIMLFHQPKTPRSISIKYDKAQQELVKRIFKIPLSDTGMLSSEITSTCELMALGRFDIDKCLDYSRSGSKSCLGCPFRQSLRGINESLENGVMSA